MQALDRHGLRSHKLKKRSKLCFLLKPMHMLLTRHFGAGPSWSEKVIRFLIRMKKNAFSAHVKNGRRMAVHGHVLFFDKNQPEQEMMSHQDDGLYSTRISHKLHS